MSYFWQACLPCKQTLLNSSWRLPLVTTATAFGQPPWIYAVAGSQQGIHLPPPGFVPQHLICTYPAGSGSDSDTARSQQQLLASARYQCSKAMSDGRKALGMRKRSRWDVETKSISSSANLQINDVPISTDQSTQKLLVHAEENAQERLLHTSIESSTNLSPPASESIQASSSSPESMNTIPDSIEAMTERLRSLRHWEYVSTAGATRDGTQNFSIMSYNVLAQCLLEDNWRLYDNCKISDLAWTNRGQRLLEEIAESNADILCLQEVQQEHYYEVFLPNLGKLGYKAIYKKRTGDKNDGCAIFYKQQNFVIDTWASVEYNKDMVPLLDRDNIAILALFRPRQNAHTRSRLCVANTHLLFNPRRGDVRLAQLRVLFAAIDQLAFKMIDGSGRQRYHPIVVCGDMNSEPHCSLYNFVCQGFLQYEGLNAAELSSNFIRKGGGCCLNSELLPSWLGITDQCQHSSVYAARISMGSESASSGRTEILESDPESEGVIPCSGGATYSSGVMSHNFNLLSVYDHELKRLPWGTANKEVTTHHGRASCTVDYIFYSVRNKESHLGNNKICHNNVEEGRLKLLGRYRLMTHNEVREFGGMPNNLLPSDHLPLMAKFAIDT